MKLKTVLRYAQIFFFLLPIFGLSSCKTTQYINSSSTLKQKPQTSLPLGKREVFYYLSPNFYRHIPDCITVLPGSDNKFSHLEWLVQERLARELTGRVNRVIGPIKRKQLERKHAINLAFYRDRKLFGKITGCNYFLQWKLSHLKDDFLFVWSWKNLILDLELFQEPFLLLWKTSHHTYRADGGFPLLPIAVPFAVARAASLKLDQDIFSSLIDQAIRRMIVTLPDVR